MLGAIDGSHIPIPAPTHHYVSYINRKNYHSVTLQGVCENNLLFTDVYAGQPGSMHDVSVYKKSTLYQRIQSGEINFHNDSHLIGDLAYPLSKHLLVGFKDFGNLNLRQKNFNVILSKTRAVIENAFAHLKGRFRRLKLMETKRLDLTALLIVSACILHNICILSKDSIEHLDINIERECREARLEAAIDLNNDNYEAGRAATEKRQNIVNSLNIIV